MDPCEACESRCFPAHRLWACVPIVWVYIFERGSISNGAVSSNDGVRGKNPKSGGKAPTVHELQYVSGHELCM